MSLEDYKIIGPIAYQGKKDCTDPRCRGRVENGKRVPGCMGYHCAYCDAPCSMMGHKCDAADAILGEARRIARGE